jgi:hypothetical protein
MDEWQTLVAYLEGTPIPRDCLPCSPALKKMKETGTSHWVESEPTVDNSSGFTALPNGYRGTYGPDVTLGSYGYW